MATSLLAMFGVLTLVFGGILLFDGAPVPGVVLIVLSLVCFFFWHRKWQERT